MGDTDKEAAAAKQLSAAARAKKEAKAVGQAVLGAFTPGGTTKALEYRNDVIKRVGGSKLAGKLGRGTAKSAQQVEGVLGQSIPQTELLKAVGGAVDAAASDEVSAVTGKGPITAPGAENSGAATTVQQDETADFVDLTKLGGGLVGKPGAAGGERVPIGSKLETNFDDYHVPKELDYEQSDLYAGPGSSVKNYRSHLSENQLINDRKSEALRKHGATLQDLYNLRGDIAGHLSKAEADRAERITARVAAGRDLWKRLDEVDAASKKLFNRALSKPIDPITRGATGILGTLAKITWGLSSKEHKESMIRMVDNAARQDLAQAKLKSDRLDAWGQARQQALKQFQATLGQEDLADQAYIRSIRGMYADKLRAFAMRAAAPEVREQALIAAQSIDERGREERLKDISAHVKRVPVYGKGTGGGGVGGGAGAGAKNIVPNDAIVRDKKGNPILLNTKNGQLKVYTEANDKVVTVPSWQMGKNAGPKYFVFSSDSAADKFHASSINNITAIGNLRAMKQRVSRAIESNDTGLINSLMADVVTDASAVMGQWAEAAGMGKAMTDKEYQRAAKGLTGNAQELQSWQGRFGAEVAARWHQDKNSPLRRVLAALTEAEQVFLRKQDAEVAGAHQVVATGPPGTPEMFFVDTQTRGTMPKERGLQRPNTSVTKEGLQEARTKLSKAVDEEKKKGGK